MRARTNVAVTRRDFVTSATLGAVAGAVVPAACDAFAAEDTVGSAGMVVTGVAPARHGNLMVKVALGDGHITSVSIAKANETRMIADTALVDMPRRIVAAQSTDVDVVSGATITSWAVKNAVDDALAKAGVSESDLGSADVSPVPVEEPLADADVVIVGAGLAGLVCAARLLQHGKTVAIFEESGHLGGSATVAYGWLTGPGTVVQAQEGVEDSPDKYYAYMEATARLWGGEIAYPDVARVYADKNGEAFDWMDSYVGVDFNRTGTLGVYDPQYMDERRIYAINNYAVSGVGAVLDLVLDGVAAGKASIMLEAPVIEVLKGSDGSAAGVRVLRADGSTLDYACAKVVLATGGYSHNVEMLKRYNYANCGTFTPSTGDGHGFDVALAAGAQLCCMDSCGTYGGGVQESGDELRYQMSLAMPNQIWVDATGNRITCEDGSYSSERAWEEARDNVVYVVFSDALRTSGVSPVGSFASFIEGGFGPEESWEILDSLVEAGDIAWKASSAEELALLAGIDADDFVRTLSAYNAACERGTGDEWGREGGQGIEGTLYAVRTVPFMCMSTGGIRVSPRGEVLGENGEPITGLYAAGEQLGLQQYAGYVRAGSGLGGAVTWGYVVADEISA